MAHDLYTREEVAILAAVLAEGGGAALARQRLSAAGYLRAYVSVRDRLRRMASAAAQPAVPARWTDAHDVIIRAGVAQGRSFAQTVIALVEAGRAGTTRNAVIGRAQRLGLAGERSQQAREARLARRADEAAKPVHQPVAPAPPAPLPAVPQAKPLPPPPMGGVPYMALAAEACRWPMAGAGAGLMGCGAQVRAGSPYCPAHHHIAYVPAPDRRVREVPDAARSRPAPSAERELDCVDAMAGGPA